MKDIYRIVKVKEGKTRDLTQIRCINDESDRVLTKDEEIKERRKFRNQLSLRNLSSGV